MYDWLKKKKKQIKGGRTCNEELVQDGDREGHDEKVEANRARSGERGNLLDPRLSNLQSIDYID